MFTSKDLKKLIIPLIFEQLLAVSVGFVDTFMVSIAGEAAVSGVALVDNISNLLIQILSALATGGAVVCSQYLGSKNIDMSKKSAGQLIFIMSTLSALLMVISLIGNHGIINFIFGKIEKKMFLKVQVFIFYITAVSYPFLGVYNAGAALFRSIGNSKISMNTSLIMNIINICGNALFIFVFNMGVAGVALATLISRIISAIIIIALMFKAESAIRIKSGRDFLPCPSIIRKILSIGLPSGLENGMFQIGKLSVSSLVSTFGTAAIAANSVANSVTMFANIPGNAIGMAMITVIGQCIGAKKPDEAKRYGKKLMFIAYAGILATNIIMTIVAVPVVGLFHLSPEATKTGLSLIHCFSLVAIFIWPLSFTMPNALRAAGDAKYTMMVSIFSMWAFRVGSSYLLGGTLGLGVLGVWFGMFIDWGFRSLAFLIRFLRGKWTQKAVI